MKDGEDHEMSAHTIIDLSVKDVGGQHRLSPNVSLYKNVYN